MTANASSKQLNAEIMLDQSVVYLLNEFIQQGATKQEASTKVADKIEAVYRKYANMGVVAPKPRTFNNNAHVDYLVKAVDDLEVYVMERTSKPTEKLKLKEQFQRMRNRLITMKTGG